MGEDWFIDLEYILYKHILTSYHVRGAMLDPGNTEIIQSLHTMSASWGRYASVDNHRIIRFKKEMTRHIQVSAVHEVLSAQKENT